MRILNLTHQQNNKHQDAVKPKVDNILELLSSTIDTPIELMYSRVEALLEICSNSDCEEVAISGTASFMGELTNRFTALGYTVSVSLGLPEEHYPVTTLTIFKLKKDINNES